MLKMVSNVFSTPIYATIKLLDQTNIFEGARPDRGLKIWPLKNFKTKIFTFEYFLNMSCNELHAPFLPYLIPVKFSLLFFLFVGGSQGVQTF